VQAVSLDGKPLTVIIEVKWSDHRDLSTSQEGQLMQQYLLENGLTHGIYLVGWCGKVGAWRRKALGGPPADRSSPEAWRRALEHQACLLRERYPSRDVRPLLLDLAWEEPEGAH